MMWCSLALNPMSRRLQIALLLAIAWFAWNTLALVIFQSPSTLQIRLSPEQNAVIAREAVTYMVTITNAGPNADPQALRNVAVNLPVPPGPKFVDTRHKNPNGYGGNPLADANVQLETVTLLSPKVFGPGEVFAMKTARSASLSSGRIDYG